MNEYRPDEQKRQERARGFSPAWLVVGVAAGFTAALGPAAVAYLTTHPIRRRVGPPPEGFPGAEEVRFPSRDGLSLSGWFLPSQEARQGIVLCHGYPNSRREMLRWAEMLRPVRAHLLLFDFRALGRSEGDLCTIGWQESEDVLGAVDYLVRCPEMGGLPVGVFGLSMGGAAAVMAAARDERIRAVATHGAYARLDRAIDQRARLFLGPLGRAASKASLRSLGRWLQEDPCRIAPVDVASRIAPRPILIFHGARDLLVSPMDGQMLYAAAGEPKRLVLMPRSRHARIHACDLPAYKEALQTFFECRARSGDQDATGELGRGVEDVGGA